MVRIVVPFGFYGWGNIGDESTLQGFAQLTAIYQRAKFRIWIASRNPSHTSEVEPSFEYYHALRLSFRGWWARRRASAYLFAGGTPITDILGSYPLADVVPIITTGYRRGKHIVFVGIGTEHLHREESRRIVSDIVAPRVQHWSVRSTRDRDRLVEYGVREEVVTVAADMAWLLDSVPSFWGREYLTSLGIDTDRPLIGVNVNNEPFILKNAPRLFECIGRFLDDVVASHRANVLFLCNDSSEGDTYDKVASAAVRSSMKNARNAYLVPNQYWSPQQMLSLIGCCQTTLSMRYHFCLFSALQGVPFIAIQRSDKVKDLCLDLNWAQGMQLGAAVPTALHDAFNEIEQQPNTWKALLRNGLSEMRRRALKNHEALDSLIPPRLAHQ